MMNDLRYALRALGRNRGFTVVATLTLALGIGLNTAIFGILNGLLFKPLAGADAGRLVWIASASTEPGGPRGHLTFPDFTTLKSRTDALSDAFVFADAPISLSTGTQAFRLSGQLVTASMFDVLGVRLSAGRTFLPEEDRTPGTHPVAVISHALWQRRFNGDPAAVGSPVTLNGRAFTIVGIGPAGFAGPDRMSPADVWVPLMMHTVIPDSGNPLSPESWWLKGVARLADGASVDQAEAVLAGVARAIAQARPDSHRGFTVTVSPFNGTDPEGRGQVIPLAALLLGMTLTVLLIACANVAGLQLSRGAGRAREIGIRLAIGATRGALVRQLLVESAVLAVMAGAAGLLLALWAAEAMVRVAGLPAHLDTMPDWRVLLFNAFVSLGSAVAFGLAPALRSARRDVAPSLRAETGADISPRASRLQRALVVAQLAVALVLLAGAGLLLRGIAQAWRVDVGFEYADRVAVSMDLRLQNYEPARAAAFYTQLLDRVRALPGVRQATVAHLVPFGGRVYSYGLSFPGRPEDPDQPPLRASVNRVWTGFFSTLRLPIVRGRDFTDQDLKAVADVAIVSEAMADRFWPDADAIGQRFSVDGPAGPFVTVVGIARDARIDEFTERPGAAAYLPHQKTSGEVTLLAWSPRPAADVLREIEAAVRALDPDLPLYASRPMRDYVAERLDGERALSKLLGLCGGLAVFLAALGLYGVMSFSVTRRTREIGIRMALGADRRSVVRLFQRDALGLAGAGLLAGALPAIGVTYLISSLFVGVSLAEPAVMIGAPLLLVAATLAASWLPTRRATRVDPIAALRTS